MTTNTKSKAIPPTPAEPKNYDLQPRQFLLFKNDKEDNPKRPDVRGVTGMLSGVSHQATISLFRQRGLGNVAKYAGPIQVRSGEDYVKVGQASFVPPRNYKPGSDLALIGRITMEDGTTYEAPAYKRVSKDGETYYGGSFLEVGEFVDPLADDEPQQA